MSKVAMRDISSVVCHHYRLSRTDFFGAARYRQVTWPRQVAMYLSQKLTKRSTPEIGHYYGGRDHTTVLHGIKAVKKRLKDPDLSENLARDIEEIIRLISIDIPLTHVFKYRFTPTIVKIHPVIIEPVIPKKLKKLKKRKCLGHECGITFTPEHSTQHLCKTQACLTRRRNAA